MSLNTPFRVSGGNPPATIPYEPRATAHPHMPKTNEQATPEIEVAFRELWQTCRCFLPTEDYFTLGCTERSKTDFHFPVPSNGGFLPCPKSASEKPRLGPGCWSFSSPEGVAPGMRPRNRREESDPSLQDPLADAVAFGCGNVYPGWDPN